MRWCQDCSAHVEGDWSRCPLCGRELVGEAAPGSLPDVPLRFTWRRVLRVLFLTSLGVIAASFLAQLLFRPDEDGLGVLRTLWLGLAALWLVVLMAISKRRNPAKSIVYLVVLVSGVCIYWDYLTDYSGWALDIAVPILCSASIVGLLIAVRVVRMAVTDYVVYSGLTVLFGLTPLVFLALGWVEHVLPSLLCGLLSLIVVAALLTLRGGAVRHELAKRLHL